MTPSPRNRPKTSRDPLARRVRQVPPSGIRKFFDLISSMEGAISLGVGEPDFTTPLHIREQAIHAIEQGYTHYTSNYGLPELRRELARHLNDHYSLDYDPKSELLITVGVSEGLDLSMRAILDPGDEVIVPEPTYVSYIPCITFAGGVPVPVPTTIESDFRVRASDIEARLSPRTKAIILCYPNNPTGAVMERDEMAAIAEVARRHDLIVVSDEVYARLVYGGHDHVCFAALPGMQERTILLGGVSKAYAMTGWRIGYAAARGEVLEGMMKIHQYTIMSAPTVGQYAAIEALRTSEADVTDMLGEYDRRRRLIVAGLNKIGMTCFEPRGAFYAFPSIKSTGLTSEEFSLKLLTEEKVAVVPGSAFGQAGEGYVRCCYAVAAPQIEEALARMGRFMDRHRRA